jgi:hypothetical protein
VPYLHCTLLSHVRAMFPFQTDVYCHLSKADVSMGSTISPFSAINEDIIPAGPVTYPEELVSPHGTGQSIKKTVKDDQLPEERFMPIQIVKDVVVEYTNQPPIADPMKKPSLPRLKLKHRLHFSLHQIAATPRSHGPSLHQHPNLQPSSTYPSNSQI